MKRKKLFDKIERPGFFRRIYLNWKFEWRYLHRDTWMGIKNLYKWLPVVWKDRDWDHTYFLQVTEFKLQEMAKYHESRKFYVGWENNVKWMRTSSRLIDRLISGYYENEVLDYYNIEMWEKPSTEEGFVEIETETTWEDFDTYFRLYPLQVKKAEDTFYESTLYQRKSRRPGYSTRDDRYSIASMIAANNHHRAQTLLFKILNTHLQRWWD